MKIEDIKLIGKTVNYSNLVSAVSFAAENSFSANDHKYHKYLQDYAETLAILAVFTNYTSEAKTETESFDEVMNIRFSDHWINEIIPELGDIYSVFVDYVDSEIEDRTRPLAKFDAVLDDTKEILDKAVQVARAIDVEKMSTVDFSKLFETLDAIYPSSADGAGKAEEEETDKDVEADNIVKLK